MLTDQKPVTATVEINRSGVTFYGNDSNAFLCCSSHIDRAGCPTVDDKQRLPGKNPSQCNIGRHGSTRQASRDQAATAALKDKV